MDVYVRDIVFSELQNVLEMRSTLSHGAPGIFDDLYFIAKAQDFILFKEVSFNLIIFMQRFFPKYKSGFLLLQTLPFLLTAFKWKSEFRKIIRTTLHGLASTNSFFIVYLVVISTPKIQNYLQMKKVKHTFPHTLLHSVPFHGPFRLSSVSCPHHHSPNAPVWISCSSCISHGIHHGLPCSSPCQSAFPRTGEQRLPLLVLVLTPFRLL